MKFVRAGKLVQTTVILAFLVFFGVMLTSAVLGAECLNSRFSDNSRRGFCTVALKMARIVPSGRHKYASIRLERGILNFATGYPDAARADVQQAMRDATLDDARVLQRRQEFSSSWSDSLVRRMAAQDVRPEMRRLWEEELTTFTNTAAN